MSAGWVEQDKMMRSLRTLTDDVPMEGMVLRLTGIFENEEEGELEAAKYKGCRAL